MPSDIAFIDPETVAPPIGAYSHLAVVPPGARLLVVAGQVGCDRAGDVPEDIRDQYRLALQNVVDILRSQGAGPQHLIHLRTFLTERVDLAGVRETRVAILGAARPPATLLYVAGLADPKYKVEVEAMAALPE